MASGTLNVIRVQILLTYVSVTLVIEGCADYLHSLHRSERGPSLAAFEVRGDYVLRLGSRDSSL